MVAVAKLLLDILQLRARSFADILTMDREPTIGTSPAALVSEAQKVECLGSRLSSFSSLCGCKASELDEASFLRMEGETEFGEAVRGVP